MLKRFTQSLSGRLFTSALILLIVFLSMTGYVLDRAFYNSAETAIRQQLETRLYAILAVAELADGQLMLPARLPEPDFNLHDSGLYAFVSDPEGLEIWRSQSSLMLTFPETPILQPGQPLFTRVTRDSSRYFHYSYRLIWEDQAGNESPYIFTIAQDDGAFGRELAAFRQTLWRWLGGIGVALLLIQWLILRWGLAPLRRLAREIRLVESGEKSQLAAGYPAELMRTTQNVNLLIKNERRQQQRYRDTLADLAHSLKTPLAVLRGSLNELDTSEKEARQQMEEQITHMDDIVRYQLQRASGSKSHISVQAVAVSPLTEKLIRNLAKVYADKTVSVELDIGNCSFRGDQGDLLEILGNLLDNAFKACRHTIKVGATTHRSGDDTCLTLCVEDDGLGIPPEKRNFVLQRGGRIDTRLTGQGIGLAVALDIVESYGGRIELSESALGGARFDVTLPLHTATT